MASAFLIYGYIGAGKTTLARELEHAHRAVRFSSDEWVAALYGSAEGAVDDFDDALERVEAVMRTVWTRCLTLGVDVVLDSGFWPGQSVIGPARLLRVSDRRASCARSPAIRTSPGPGSAGATATWTGAWRSAAPRSTRCAAGSSPWMRTNRTPRPRRAESRCPTGAAAPPSARIMPSAADTSPASTLDVHRMATCCSDPAGFRATTGFSVTRHPQGLRGRAAPEHCRGGRIGPRTVFR